MNDTIAAIATAYGEGGIGIIRISGEESLNILKKIFNCGSKEITSRQLNYGKIVNPQDGSEVDEVLAVYMAAPKTYTMEDVVEINCHGSMISLRKTLALVLEHGARLAEPGEFTKRAFLNGRLDLSQAEAVIDLIKAKTDKSFDVALSQLDGSLSKHISEIRKSILDLLVNITVNIDYPDEDIEELTYEETEKNISLIGEMIENMLSTASTGRMIREGLRVAIVGKPNVGKSSLMNSLLKETRAIVTSIPGTTRDTIEEAISIRNIPVYLTDTAGIRETDDTIEKIGIEKSKEAFNKSDLIVFVLDSSSPLDDEDKYIIEYLQGHKVLVILNKQDLGAVLKKHHIEELLPDAKIIEASLINDEGITDIEDTIEDLVYGGQVTQGESLMVNNVRHIELLRQSKESMDAALNMARLQEALDFIEVDVRDAYEKLGEIIGETVSDDVINEVFARFCLGK